MKEKTDQELKRYYSQPEICKKLGVTRGGLLWLVLKVFLKGKNKISQHQYLKLKSAKS